ncbi:methyltransferase domain-containing protein [Pseudodesulfovibrio cashew]|uniref:Methyltransferase domain-containing protein n=1 Tax=Pseudodesulfovibrio cashew TaxID=2678688 RepID=A0A6I6JIJ2_9BACT|nr:methyltransferase domain-containing protein [Pseudodesulfovibrio cashew]
MAEPAPLWERPELRDAAGLTLRPGGFSLTDRGAELIGLLPGWRVLDVGSGLGATTSRLRARYGAEAYGVEPSSVQVERAESRIGLVQALGDELPFTNGAFKAIFCECVFSLFPVPGVGLSEFRRVLEPGGFLVLSDLCSGDSGTAGGGSCADRAVPLRRTRDLLEAAGFTIFAVEDHTRLLRELAARLAFAGSSECLCNRGKLGYYLMIAQKKEC